MKISTVLGRIAVGCLAIALMAFVVPSAVYAAALPPSEPPSIPDLNAADDTGTSSSDNLTNQTTSLSFSGSAVVGTTSVQLYDGDVLIGTDDSLGGAGTWEIVMSPGLAEGSHSLTAVGVRNGVSSAHSVVLAVTVDTTAPQIIAARVTAGNEITVEYSESVTGEASDYTDLTIGRSDPRSVTVQDGDGAAVHTLTFDGAPVPAGRRATLDINNPIPRSVADEAGNDLPATDDYDVVDGQPHVARHSSGVYIARSIGGTPPQLPVTPSAPSAAILAPAIVFSRTLLVGMSGDDVKQLQLKLKALGFFPADTDATGLFGPITEAAVKAFQASHGIPQLGIVGPLTRAALNM